MVLGQDTGKIQSLAPGGRMVGLGNSLSSQESLECKVASSFSFINKDARQEIES